MKTVRSTHDMDDRHINVINPILLDPFQDLLEGLEAMLWSHWAFTSIHHVSGDW